MASRSPETDPKVQLGELLKLAREQSPDPKTQDALGKVLLLTRSAIGHGETGERVPNSQTLGRWLDALGVQGLARTAIERMHRLARLTERDPSDVKVEPFYTTEARAHTVRYWAPIILPGIVQTGAYATALFGAGAFDAARMTEKLEVRMGRQAILERQDPPDTSIVVWQPVLHHQIGTKETMREQCDRLVKLTNLPAVSIHVLPSGANPGLGGAIQLAATDDAPELLLSDSLVEDQLSNNPVVVRRASSTFNSVRADAQNRAGSRDILMKAMETWSE